MLSRFYKCNSQSSGGEDLYSPASLTTGPVGDRSWVDTLMNHT